MTSQPHGTVPPFLTAPQAVIAQIISQAEPLLGPAVITTVITSVADTRAKQRRLAQALAADPGLLTSGRPEGPRLAGMLIHALHAHGARHVVPPRCARCGQGRPLVYWDGPLRICVSCESARRRRTGRCSNCGQARETRYRDRDDQPRCPRCGPADPDPAGGIASILAAMDTGLPREILLTLIGQAIPRPAQQRRAHADLAARPGLLTGDGAHGSPRIIALIETLHAHQARNITPPACPFCDRTIQLRFRRDGLRCCRACYYQPRAEPCGQCGRRGHVASRTPQGQPLCRSCDRASPANLQNCTRCGRLRPVYHRDSDQVLCHACWRAPMAVCSLCSQRKPCYFASTSSPRCENCSERLRAQPCGRCGNTASIWTRTPAGEPLCESCGRGKEPCVRCGRAMRVQARGPAGPLCKTCYRKDPLALRPCVQCGNLRMPHHHGLCAPCAAPIQLRALLTGPDGTLRPHAGPVIAALTASDSTRLLEWLREPAPRRLLAALAATTGPITHATLDQLRPALSAQRLREILLAAGALPQRDEHLARLERWLDSTLAKLPDPGERQALRQYTTWTHLRRLRRQPAGKHITPAQTAVIRRDAGNITRLLAHLRQRGHTLATATQADIDAWLATGPASRRNARNFLTWATSRHHAPRIDIPARADSRPRAGLPHADQRWQILHRLLHDGTLHTTDRVAGCLLLLYGQPLSRITALTTSQVTHTSTGQVQLLLGTKPIDVPPPLSSLLTTLTHNRHGFAVIGRTASHPWLFPGGAPGRPLSAARLGERLRNLGIYARRGRNSTLMDLAAELPAAILSQLLGIHITTATEWTTAAGNTRPGYAAEIGRRSLSHTPEQ